MTSDETQYPHPAQVLFDRIVRTWVRPRQSEGTLNCCLILWGSASSEPSVLLNDEAMACIEGFHARLGPRTTAAVHTDDLHALSGVTLLPRLRQQAFIALLRGRDGLYFVVFQRLQSLELSREFRLLRDQLCTRGLQLVDTARRFPIFLDVTQNLYFGTPAMKRRRTIEDMRTIGESLPGGALACVRRQRALPILIASLVPHVTELLIEARETYVRGHYFSAIATASTTADRICLYLASRYDLGIQEQRWLRKQTFGAKLEKLKSMELIDVHTFEGLRRLNAIRNRHLHPQQPVSGLAVKRDALAALRLLHHFVEATMGVFRDYQVENGRLVPKPVV